MALEFRVLGPVEVLVGGQLVELGPRRQRTVLARLLVDAGRPVAVDRLLHDVWGGDPPPGALRTLRSYLSRLRAALGTADAVLVTRAPGYVLDVPPASIDAARFEQLADEGRALLRRRNARAAAVRLRDALALWRGVAFADLPGEPFVVTEAARLEGVRAGAVEDRIEADLALGRHVELIGELEALVEKNPLRERLWAHLMVALYGAGRPADAVATYQRARKLLAEELGLDPGPELRRLESAILRHELPITDPEPPTNLPEPLTAFVGRERELDEVSFLVERDRLVTLTGVGGGGKTRIAIEVAGLFLTRFPDGVWIADLAPLSDPALMAQTVAAAVGIEERSGRPAATVLAEHLAKVDMLVVLDNCEHLAADCARLVQRLLEAAPRLHVLATSREPLLVPGETVFEVPPMAAPPPGEDGAAATYDAVRLFLDRSAVPVEPDALPTVARICRELDGIPLAIEIAAAQTALLAPDDIATRLSDRFRLLSYWSRAALPRHRTLRASIEWSYALLDADERAVFHRLAVFAGDFTVAAAECVATPAGAEAVGRGTLGILRRLVDASLVQRSPRADGPRFRLLETVRQYALERAKETGDGPDARRRHAELYATLADEAGRAAESPEEARRYAQLDAEHANLRAALEWAHAVGDRGLLARLARGMGNYWRLRGYLDEGEIWLGRAIEVSEHLPPEEAADLHGFLSYVHLRRNEFELAWRRAAAAVDLARRGDDARQLARWIHQLAFPLRAQGKLTEAKEVVAEALEISRRIGDRTGTAHRLGMLADIAVYEGRFDDAERLFGEIWELIQPAKPAVLALFLESTSRLALERGDLAAGERRAEEGLVHARAVGDVWHIGLLLVALAYVARRRGELGRARTLLVDALDTLWSIREMTGVAEVLDVLGGLLLDVAGPASAARAFLAADALRTRCGVPVAGPVRGFAAAERVVTRERLGEEAWQAAWAVAASTDTAVLVEAMRQEMAEGRATAAVG